MTVGEAISSGFVSRPRGRRTVLRGLNNQISTSQMKQETLGASSAVYDF
jgi:hypothetical protein